MVLKLDNQFGEVPDRFVWSCTPTPPLHRLTASIRHRRVNLKSRKRFGTGSGSPKHRRDNGFNWPMNFIGYCVERIEVGGLVNVSKPTLHG